MTEPRCSLCKQHITEGLASFMEFVCEECYNMFYVNRSHTLHYCDYTPLDDGKLIFSVMVLNPYQTMHVSFDNVYHEVLA